MSVTGAFGRSGPVDVLVAGDQFIGASYYTSALGEILEPGAVTVRTVTWAGSKKDHHEAQQQMEHSGPGAVPVPEKVRDAVSGAEVLIVHFTPVPAAILRAGPRLRAVIAARTGVENVDVAAASALGIAVANVAGRNASAVAELAIALMLCETRNIARADASVKSGGWRKDFPGARLEIGGSTVGLVGLGHVGREIARRLSGFGCRLLVADPYASAEQLTAAGGTRVGLDEVFAQSDFISVQARVTPQTERFIGAAQLALMKPTAYLVNVGRSKLIRTEDLYAVLRAGQIAGAALDVFDDEPLPPDSPWRELDNVTVTTHFGGDTEQTNVTSARLVARACAELVRTGRISSTVNAAALQARASS